MILLVCGGRDYRDRRRVFDFLDTVHDLIEPVTLVRHGAARGADTLGAEWAVARGIPQDPYPANWYPSPGRLDRGAGFARNAQMAKMPTDLCVAFPGGNGTADMVRRAEAAGVCTVSLGTDGGEETRHGVNCLKAAHNGGDLHAPEDDTPFDVDGVRYCGRCHRCL